MKKVNLGYLVCISYLGPGGGARMDLDLCYPRIMGKRNVKRLHLLEWFSRQIAQILYRYMLNYYHIISRASLIRRQNNPHESPV
jgi:hypothetical protein